MEKKTTPVVKIFLAAEGGRGSPFCGPGMVKLLEYIHETGNVRSACETMGMSYSKGWKLLRALETYLEYPVTVRQQGGKGGGEAHLTKQGESFLKRYKAFETESRETILKLFGKHYGGGTVV
ncbi:MAG: hypothetical protein Ta2F_04900 [Termitinemataceae bacterium]|nr:MAG: hypothetical protein Ta2F_04900 [Termitinemataceae bacterium]